MQQPDKKHEGLRQAIRAFSVLGGIGVYFVVVVGICVFLGSLADAQLGSAPRAVGQACGANPLPLLVPCHRVIAGDGGLGGFARQRGDLQEIGRAHV